MASKITSPVGGKELVNAINTIIDTTQDKLPNAASVGQVLKSTDTTGGIEWGDASGGNIDNIKAGGKDLPVVDKRIEIDKVLTKSEYNSLTTEEKNNGTTYIISDEDTLLQAEVVQTTGISTENVMSQNAVSIELLNKVSTFQGTENYQKILGVNISGNVECIDPPTSHYIGELISIIGCASTYIPEGFLPCDGSEYSKSQFPILYTDYLTSSTPKLVTCSYADYASDIATYGQCSKWAIDTGANKFKVPIIKDGSFLQQAQSNAEIGKSYNAGLPNITGAMMIARTMAGEAALYANGAFSDSYKTGTSQPAYSDGAGDLEVHFNANNGSATAGIYRNDVTTVQPNAVTVRYFVCVAGGSVNQSMMDWSAWASGLAGKLNADGTNLGTTTGTGTVKAVTESYYDSTTGSWYRVWSDGWIEQGGKFDGLSGVSTFTFLKNYTNTDYCIQVTVGYNNNNNPSNSSYPYSVTQTGFTLQRDGHAVCRWYACGY